MREFRPIGVKAQRKAVVELALAKAVGNEIARKLRRDLDFSEAWSCG
jgi:CPA1 family monovalent cation:H+ antiporter